MIQGQTRQFFAIVTILATLVTGCVHEVVMREKPLHTCPTPVVLCKPGSFDRVTFDTGITGTGYYLSIEQVEHLNTGVDEFGVSFPSGPRGRGDGLATIREQKDGIRSEMLHPVRFSDPAIAEVLDPIEPDAFINSFGTAAWRTGSDSLLLVGRFPGTVEGDYDLAAGLMGGPGGISTIGRAAGSRILSWESQPALSPDGSALYFVSSRLDGLGGTDIYVMRRRADGLWSDPENLGPAVNTPCDDLSPFVSSDGTWLYFSSSGHETVGGYDIFRSRLLAGRPSQAENIGRPLNTPADEIFPSSPPGTDPDTLLYYSSNQKGSDRFDVWVLTRRLRGGRGGQVPRDRPDSVRLSGTVVTSEGQPVDGATVTLDEGDPPRRVDSTKSGRDGSYGFTILEGRNYEVTASKEGELYGRETVNVPTYNNRDEVRRDVVFLDTVVFRVNFPFNDASNPYEYTLDDRGLPTNRRWSEVIAQAAEVLRRIEPGSGTTIELVGHTDPIGSDAYNIDLGRRRAEFIRRELVMRGVSPRILTVSSAGEQRPLPMYDQENDELYRARLRRVELYRKN